MSFSPRYTVQYQAYRGNMLNAGRDLTECEANGAVFALQCALEPYTVIEMIDNATGSVVKSVLANGYNG